SNNNNCGSCGHVCGTGMACNSGQCTNTSNPGTGGNSNPGTGGSGGSSNPGTGGSSNPGTGGSATGRGGAGGTSNAGTGGSTTGRGGTTGTGGTSGTTGTGGSGTGANPPGYYMTKDWGVTSVDWHGCVWTGIDSTVAGSTTSVSPQDFTNASKEG